MQNKHDEPTTPLNESLLPAYSEWADIVGNGAVLLPNAGRSKQDLDRYQIDCRLYPHSANAVVKPRNIDQLRRCVQVAAKHNLHIYPISCGCNWGYGTRTPASDSNTIFDLSALNNIIEINSELSYAIVEPGVTQQQLCEAIEKAAPGRFADVSGSSPQASILGNILERGYGLTPYADHFTHGAGMEVMLADGTLFSTGMGRFSNSRNAFIYKWGLGPFLDGLFTQSNFGIVTKVGVWLMPKLDKPEVIAFDFEDDSQLCAAIPALRELKLKGLLKGALHIANDLRVISSFQQCPEEYLDQRPLPAVALSKLRKEHGVKSWNAMTGLWSTPQLNKAEKIEIQQTLRAHCKIKTLFSSSSNRLLGRIFRSPNHASKSQRNKLFDLFNGIPSETPMMSTYWRSKTKAPIKDRDPASDSSSDCGLIWCAPIVPLTSSDMSKFLETSRRVLSYFRFDFNVTVTLINERSACCTIAILFNKKISEESIAAEECRKTLLVEMLKLGYIPYRVGSDINITKDLLFNENSDFIKVCKKIKDSLDPQGIISPSRYGI